MKKNNVNNKSLLPYNPDIIASEFLNISMILTILDDIEVAIVAVDDKGLIYYANKKYGEHIGKSLHDIIGKCLPDVYKGSTTMVALNAKKRIVIEKKTCPIDASKLVRGITRPIIIDDKLLGAFSLYMDMPMEKFELDSSTEGFFASYIRQRLFDSAKELDEFNIIGQSDAFLEIIEKASIIAETDVSVMIGGESGVGKEVIAKYIHNKSHRKDKPFVVINCASIPEALVESELFGYEGGSFTGAKPGGKPGKFELAKGGTLFLDEIGDMPLSMQPKLLRAIQENEIERIGGEKPISTNIRIISATNRPLTNMVAENTFRQDLYYRINSFNLQIPPLRERREDIRLFLGFYLEKFNEKYNKNVSLSPDALSFLCNQDWPGNVREIRSYMENLVILTAEGECGASAIRNYSNQKVGNEEKVFIHPEKKEDIKSLNQIMDEAERNAIIEALERTNGNKTKAMDILGISRKTFYKKLNKYDLI
ncbi:MAG: sigma-54 interaction domain-containing protein [Anaerovoracaceae bacterium]|jgi:transcriptional regulator with PAS, ATPase and Fis domain